jgi:hypothetical protein
MVEHRSLRRAILAGFAISALNIIWIPNDLAEWMRSVLLLSLENKLWKVYPDALKAAAASPRNTHKIGL